LPRADRGRDHRVGAADEISIVHPSDDVTRMTAAVVLGGPMLYLAGILLFKWALWGLISWPRAVAIGVLAALIPLAAVSSVLLLSAAAMAVLVGLAGWDAYRMTGREHVEVANAVAAERGV